MGDSDTADSATHAAIWVDGKITDPGTLAGMSFSSAIGIDQRGETVGHAWTNLANAHAVAWQRAK